MNLLLIDREELAADGGVLVRGRRYEHLRKVLHVQEGQRIHAGLVRGPRGMAEVLGVGDGSIALRFEATEVRSDPRIALVIAVPRPKALSRMVQSAASFGIERIDIIGAWRVDDAYFESHKLEPRALAEDVRLGCEQGEQTFVPDIEVHRCFANFVDEVLRPRLLAAPERRLLIGHPDKPEWPSVGIEKALAPGFPQPVTLVLGPDGGFIDRELRRWTALGGALVHFGEAVLRSEIALVSGLSQIALIRRL